jgi:transcriptional regulator with XRE-family HTH domain
LSDLVPFSNVVKRHRELRGMGLRAFGDAVGVSRQTILDWERGKYLPGEFALLPLALHNNDWRRDFAIDALSVLKPELYAPATSIPVSAGSSAA